MAATVPIVIEWRMLPTPETPCHGRPPVGIVVAMTRSGVIGRDGRLPWDLSADRQLFRRLTEGHTVIMGRQTFDSLPAPLVNRTNLVLSRSVCQRNGAIVCGHFLEAVAIGWRLGQPIFIIGGAEVYRQALPIADTLHISWVADDYPGDRRFPPLDLRCWVEVAAVEFPGFRHVTYRRADQEE